ncbi:hypothetical protein KIPB_012068 [Kipferlia bialata]|uniref:Uncharacterized protein n=1 Tax=Kipferlia bialata TaxID=797122 RepID=A0A9K3D6P8_9EUKA|nr:hypothetical protein KIPB_012068 [Kipferlia bialata]|eukprot:g12068.t1
MSLFRRIFKGEEERSAVEVTGVPQDAQLNNQIVTYLRSLSFSTAVPPGQIHSLSALFGRWETLSASVVKGGIPQEAEAAQSAFIAFADRFLLQYLTWYPSLPPTFLYDLAEREGQAKPGEPRLEISVEPAGLPLALLSAIVPLLKV